jgi:hypothetical protein
MKCWGLGKRGKKKSTKLKSSVFILVLFILLVFIIGVSEGIGEKRRSKILSQYPHTFRFALFCIA